jgi:NADH-quinone oxidoreductase subunit C
VTESTSDAGTTPAADPTAEFAAAAATAAGATHWTAAHGNAKVFLDRDSWRDGIRRARDELGLVFLSWLSATDWTTDVAVGDPPADPEAVEERFEVLCWLGRFEDGLGITFSTDLPKDDPSLDSLVPVFAGAEWHEREAHEMFGIHFRDHPRLINLYLPDAFEGHPLRKSFALLSREVKPWPGDVDVEAMPAVENPEGAS